MHTSVCHKGACLILPYTKPCKSIYSYCISVCIIFSPCMCLASPCSPFSAHSPSFHCLIHPSTWSPSHLLPSWSLSLSGKQKGAVAPNNKDLAVYLNMKLSLICIWKVLNGAWSYAYLQRQFSAYDYSHMTITWWSNTGHMVSHDGQILVTWQSHGSHKLLLTNTVWIWCFDNLIQPLSWVSKLVATGDSDIKIFSGKDWQIILCDQSKQVLEYL